MKNVFALSALFIASLIQAGESFSSSLESCLECTLECTKEITLEYCPIAAACGFAIGLCGEGAKFYRLDRSEGPQRSGNAFDHSAERLFFNDAEDMLAEYGPTTGVLCCTLPVACHTCALCTLRCCYSKKRD